MCLPAACSGSTGESGVSEGDRLRPFKWCCGVFLERIVLERVVRDDVMDLSSQVAVSGELRATIGSERPSAYELRHYSSNSTKYTAK
jgi:hypothetical protein